MTMNNGSQKTKSEDFKEWKVLANIFMVSLLLSFSLFYMNDGEAFKESNKKLIVLLETGSATFAIIAFTLERFKLTEKLCSPVRWALNIATLAFFLITVPHLFVSSVNDTPPNSTASYLIIFFSFLVLGVIIFYAISLFIERPGVGVFLGSLVITAIIFLIIIFSENLGVTQKIINASQWLLEALGLSF